MGEGLERGQSCCLASGGLLGICPISTHFTHLPYATGTFLSVALVVIHGAGAFVYIAGPLNGLFWEIRSLFSCSTFPSTGFYSQKLRGFLFPALELCSLSWVWDCSLPRYPSSFYPPHVNMEPPTLSLLLPPLCTTPHPLFPNTPSPPLLPVWMNMAALNPWLLDFHTILFSGSSEYFLFSC